MDTYNSLNHQFGSWLNHLLATYIDPSLDYQTVGLIGLVGCVTFLIFDRAH